MRISGTNSSLAHNIENVVMTSSVLLEEKDTSDDATTS